MTSAVRVPPAVMIETDGTVSILSQQADVGVNPWTTYCRIVADELGVPLKDVHIKAFDECGFLLMTPDGSCNLCSNGFIVRKAARQAKAMLLDLAATKFELAAEDLDIKDGVIFEKKNPENRKTIGEVAVIAMPGHNAVGTWTEPPVLAWAWHTQGIWGKPSKPGARAYAGKGILWRWKLIPRPARSR